MRTGHLFAGAGGGLYADIILGHRPQFAVEWDGYAAQCLRERASEGWWPGLHVHEGDVQLFDSSPWRGRVDSIHAGFPCQDISVAGTGAGITGQRSGLWAEVVRVADDIRPRELFLENSPAITGRGLEQILGDLAELGFDAEWIVLPASAVGAPHIRARWWCLARLADTSSGRCLQQEGRQVEQPRGTETERASDDTDADRVRELQQERVNQKQRRRASNMGQDVSDSARHGCGEEPADTKRRGAGNSTESRPAGFDTGCADMAYTDQERWNWRAGFVGPGRRREFENGGQWSIEPTVGRVAHGVANRSHRIKALGNGQVPLQAAAAYVLLDARLGT